MNVIDRTLTSPTALPYALTEIERQSAVWQKVETMLHERLQELRQKNDGPMDQEHRDALIAEIAIVKRMLRLGDEPIKPMAPPPRL